MKASTEFELCTTDSELDGPYRVNGSLCDVSHDNDLSHKGWKWGENWNRKLESSDNFYGSPGYTIVEQSQCHQATCCIYGRNSLILLEVYRCKVNMLFIPSCDFRHHIWNKYLPGCLVRKNTCFLIRTNPLPEPMVTHHRFCFEYMCTIG